MSKMSKAIAVLGVVAGLGVAALPLSSYAAEGGYSVNDSAKVTTKVEGAISISVEVSDTVKDLNLGVLTPNGEVKSGDLKVTVGGNAANTYDLTMSATAMSTADGKASIPAGVPTQNSSAWGYKIGEGAWQPAPVSAEADVNGTSIADGGITTVTFGASAAAGQAAGDYSSTVTFVATVNN